jgi:hypothetical protein
MNPDPWGHGNATYSRTNNTNPADASCPVHSVSTDYGVRFRCGQDNEAPNDACNQQYGDNQMFHHRALPGCDEAMVVDRLSRV